jgi:hypothetical protein
LEEVVELGEHQKKSNLFAGVAKDHYLPPLGGPALNEHQCAESCGVHVPGAGKIDYQAADTFRHLFQQPNRSFANLDTGVES